jgi:hypothetical protein
MRNRFFLPNLGRFMQSDPLGFNGGDMNLFRYCGNDPVNGSDPFGLHDLGDEAELAAWNFAAFGLATTERITVTGTEIPPDPFTNPFADPTRFTIAGLFDQWSNARLQAYYSNTTHEFGLRESTFDLTAPSAGTSNSQIMAQVTAVLDHFAPSLGGTEMAGTITSQRKVILGPENGRTPKSSKLPAITSDTIAIWHFHLVNIPNTGNPYIFSYPPFGFDTNVINAHPNIPQFVGVLDGPPGQFTIFGYLSPEQPYVIVRPNKGHTPGF